MRQTAQMFYLNITQIMTLSYWLFGQRLDGIPRFGHVLWIKNAISRTARIFCQNTALIMWTRNKIIIAIFHKNFPNCPNRNYAHSISLMSFGQRLQKIRAYAIQGGPERTERLCALITRS